ncbi:MAG: biopolymer transporter ExbD [Phycisphaerales bacterium]|nr:biopolymer transporter ExbD [Phycisphaerales bacterium]
MISSRKQSGHHKVVDLTPMIDVVFQLIIFFMLTSHLGELRRTEVDLPVQPGQEQRDGQDAAMIIDIGPDGVYMVESVEVNLNEIHRLASAGIGNEVDPENFDVLIRPDRNAPAVYLDRVLNKLAGVGVTRWKLGTMAPDGNGGG